MLQQRLTIEDLCRKLRPVFGKKIDDIYLRYAMAESREEKEDIMHMISALYSKNLNKLLDNQILLEPPNEDALDGDYHLADVSYAGKKIFSFNLREKDWSRHVCISGMSGSGKTTLAFNILQTFIDHDKPFLVFDWKKSFRPLLLASQEVVCFTIGDESASNMFKTNINRPPKGIDPKEWINVLCDLIIESFSASFGVHKVLLETLDEAFEHFGVYNGSDNYPTWNNIKWYLDQKIEKTKGREAGWLESALRIVSVLTFGNFGKVCNSKEKGVLSVEDLLNKKVVFELNALSNIEKKFFCEFVLTYIYKLKKARQKNSESKFVHAIVVDEAHNIFLKGNPHFTKESVTDMIYREMREYGTSLICLDQHISKLSDTVKGNSACNIAFQQQLSQDIYDISGLTQLRDQQQFFSMLPVGSAIVKLSERYTSPFLIEVHNAELRGKTVTDEEVKSRAEFHIMGISVEKEADKEFNDALIGRKTMENPVKRKEVSIEDIKHDRTVFKAEDILPLDDGGIVYEVINEPLGGSFPKRANNEFLANEPSGGVFPRADSEILADEYFGKMFPKTNEVPKPVFAINQNFESVPRAEIIVNKIFENKEDDVFYELKKMAYGISLTPRQEVLFDYIKGRVKLGDSLKELENTLLFYKQEGNYKAEDVFVAVNHYLSSKLANLFPSNKKEEKAYSQIVTPIKSRKIYKENHSRITGSSASDEERVISFLSANPGKDFGTVELYKELGLSSRKGNKIKNELLERKIIIIEEKKNDKGWKKIIALAK
ncbi:MAG: DUF87 domain-containing protein [Nanoarchaeota archaeon]